MSEIQNFKDLLYQFADSIIADTSNNLESDSDLTIELRNRLIAVHLRCLRQTGELMLRIQSALSELESVRYALMVAAENAKRLAQASQEERQ